MAVEVARVVALGASNLARGLPNLVYSARAAWGPGVEVVAALGHGRSYGVRSRVFVRTLPGILESGLWRALASHSDAPTRALVTDVGNDILYGYAPEEILAWVEEAVSRLQRLTRDIILTALPLGGIGRVSQKRFLLLRTVFFPSCRLSLNEVLERAGRVDAGLAELSRCRALSLVRPNPAWYGFDPIHIRPSASRSAWREILGIDSGIDEGSGFGRDALRVALLRPEREWLFGTERITPQTGVKLASGGRLRLY